MVKSQITRVCEVFSAGGWYTLAEVAQRSGAPEASVSARLRDLRKSTFGGYVVSSRKRGTELEYRVETDLLKRVQESSLLGSHLKTVFGAVYERGPLTGNELDEFLGSRVRAAHTFLADLERLGVVARKPKKRPCTTTGKLAAEWFVTGNMPSAPKEEEQLAPPTPSQLKEFCKQLVRMHQISSAHGFTTNASFRECYDWLAAGAPRSRGT